MWLFTGCVMDAWQRAVHAAVDRGCSAATGCGVALPGAGGDCCGALHVHAGLADDARRLAATGDGVDARRRADRRRHRRLRRRAEGLRPPARHARGASAFAARVVDVHEWLAPRLDALPAPPAPASRPVAVQDPCHLRHVQRAHLPCAPCSRRTSTLVELDDEGLCCGAGGAYSALQPELAERDPRAQGRRRSRAAAAPTSWRAPTPAARCTSPPPGVDVRHPMEIARRGAAMAGEFDDIRGRLEAIAEELADLAIVRLRESIDAGGTELPVDERRLDPGPSRRSRRRSRSCREPDDVDLRGTTR